MRLSIFLFLIFFTTCLFSQRVTYLYPVKKNHKWGYIDKRGRIVIEPKYDAIGDQYLRWHGRNTESPYRLVEADRKLGLINDQCQEVLPIRFDKIYPLNPSLFIVQEDTLLHIVDRTGNSALNEGFEEVLLLDTLWGRYLKIKKKGLWGVHELGVGEILPPIYLDIEIQRAGDVFFKIRKPGEEKLWGLVNTRNKIILPNRYFDIRCVNENFFTTLSAIDQWEIRDSTGQQFLKGSWAVCIPLNRHFIGLELPNDRMRLFSCAQKDTIAIAEPYDELQPFNERYILYRNGFRSGLLDTTGNVALPSIYLNVKTFGDSLFRVQRFGAGWGVLSLSRGLLLPTEYDSIYAFEGPFAKIEKADLLGLMDTSMQELIPPAFDRLVVSDSLIKGYDSGNLSLFKITDSGQVALMDEFSNVRTLRVGYNKKYYTEATPARRRIRVAGGVLDGEASPFTAQTDGRWIWKRDTDTGRWGMTDQNAPPEWGIPPYLVEVLHLKEPELSLVFTDEKVTENSADVLPALSSVQSFFRAAFFSHKTGKFITGFDLIGLRGHDFHNGLPFAVFLDKDGHFGLIDREGKTASLPSGKPLCFTWIGEFNDGRARFCQGGRLVLTEEGKQEKTAVSVVDEFMVQFGMNTTLSYGMLENREMMIEKKGEEPLRWGYIDTLGHIVIEPQFEFAGDFENKFAVNKKEGLWGVINMEGEEVLPFKYNNINPYFGNWLVSVKSPTRLVFNPNGYERVTKLYKRQGVFSEKRCQVQLDSLWGYIDEEGRRVDPLPIRGSPGFLRRLGSSEKEGVNGHLSIWMANRLST